MARNQAKKKKDETESIALCRVVDTARSADGPISYGELMRRTGLGASQLRPALYEALRLGAVKFYPGGLYLFVTGIANTKVKGE